MDAYLLNTKLYKLTISGSGNNVVSLYIYRVGILRSAKVSFFVVRLFMLVKMYFDEDLNCWTMPAHGLHLASFYA